MSNDDLVDLRHHIHSIAEVSGEENDTAAFIKRTLQKFNPNEIMTALGGHGVMARFGSQEDAPAILIRCELDALPIAEENDLEYASKTEGVGHKCGHDGHMAILCGVAQKLSERSSFDGCVYLLFQPAEETGKGARKVLDDQQFKDINPDYVFALHNVPGFEKHTIVVKSGPFAAASVGFIARFSGQTAHAAHPEEGRSPALAVAQLIQSVSSLPQFYAPMDKATKATVIQSHLGEQAFGTSPANGEVMATLRTYSDDMLEKVKERSKKLANGIADTYNLELATKWVEPFPATVNNEHAVDIVRVVAESEGLEIINKEAPFGWSEDFGHFTEAYKGALFGLGSGGDQPALHAANYDFPDKIIETGVKMFIGIIDKIIE